MNASEEFPLFVFIQYLFLSVGWLNVVGRFIAPRFFEMFEEEFPSTPSSRAPKTSSSSGTASEEGSSLASPADRLAKMNAMKAKQKAKLDSQKKKNITGTSVSISDAKAPSGPKPTTMNDISAMIKEKSTGGKVPRHFSKLMYLIGPICVMTDTDYSIQDAKDLSSTERQLRDLGNREILVLFDHLLCVGIAPVFDPTLVPTAVDAPSGALDLSDIKNFLFTPAPRGIQIQCYVVRNKRGMNKMFPTFELYMDGPQFENKFLMAAKKRSSNKTSNYIMSMDLDSFEKEASGCVGKLRSNFAGTEFTIFNRGLAPKDVKQLDSVQATTVRKELGAVHYEQNVLGSRGPRKMSIFVPTVGSDNKRANFQPMKDEESMNHLVKQGVLKNLVYLVNKSPSWNDTVHAYVLNFGGRVTQASVKNFQLVQDNDQSTVLMQFGRVAKDKFTMDFRWPLCPLQAFGIALTSLDYKFACE
jgi:tubby-related protein 1